MKCDLQSYLKAKADLNFFSFRQVSRSKAVLFLNNFFYPSLPLLDPDKDLDTQKLVEKNIRTNTIQYFTPYH